ncbi:MAG: hypothetical protein Q4D33_10185, partial [Prevotellaceae bacterium]|nr:hypothetical protein [Prevotellaceae bacterium]
IKAEDAAGSVIVSKNITIDVAGHYIGQVKVKQDTMNQSYDVKPHKFNKASFNWKDGYKNKVVAVNKKVRLSWKKPAITPYKYVVFKRASKSRKYKAVKTITDPNTTHWTYSENVTDSVFKDETSGRYYYKVRAYFN